MNSSITRATMFFAACALMLGEIVATDGKDHPHVESFAPLVDAGTAELSDATGLALNGLPVPEAIGPQIPDDLYEHILTTGARCALLARRREEFGPDDHEVTMWTGLVRSSIDEVAAAMLALLAQPGAVGEASE